MKSKNSKLFKCLQFVQCETKFIFQFFGGINNRIKPERSIELTVNGNSTIMMPLHMGYESFRAQVDLTARTPICETWIQCEVSQGCFFFDRDENPLLVEAVLSEFLRNRQRWVVSQDLSNFNSFPKQEVLFSLFRFAQLIIYIHGAIFNDPKLFSSFL